MLYNISIGQHKLDFFFFFFPFITCKTKESHKKASVELSETVPGLLTSPGSAVKQACSRCCPVNILYACSVNTFFVFQIFKDFEICCCGPFTDMTTGM